MMLLLNDLCQLRTTDKIVCISIFLFIFIFFFFFAVVSQHLITILACVLHIQYSRTEAVLYGFWNQMNENVKTECRCLCLCVWRKKTLRMRHIMKKLLIWLLIFLFYYTVGVKVKCYTAVYAYTCCCNCCAYNGCIHSISLF